MLTEENGSFNLIMKQPPAQCSIFFLRSKRFLKVIKNVESHDQTGGHQVEEKNQFYKKCKTPYNIR